jgi:hypothetical protein
MPQIMIRCPKTGKPTPTGMHFDEVSFATSQFRNNIAPCPHCGSSHMWSKEDAWVSGQKPPAPTAQ